MSDRHIAIRAEGIMFAAIVNTRTALVNTLAFIAAHPEAQSKVRMLNEFAMRGRVVLMERRYEKRSSRY
jgi:cytochrome P450